MVTVNDGSLQWVAGIDTSQLKKEVDKTNQLFDSMGRKAEEQATKLDSLARKAAGGLAAYISLNATSQFINQIVRVRGEFQQL